MPSPLAFPISLIKDDILVLTGNPAPVRKDGYCAFYLVFFRFPDALHLTHSEYQQIVSCIKVCIDSHCRSPAAGIGSLRGACGITSKLCCHGLRAQTLFFGVLQFHSLWPSPCWVASLLSRWRDPLNVL